VVPDGLLHPWNHFNDSLRSYKGAGETRRLRLPRVLTKRSACACSNGRSSPNESQRLPLVGARGLARCSSVGRSWEDSRGKASKCLQHIAGWVVE
jgi:hypothetical protein